MLLDQFSHFMIIGLIGAVTISGIGIAGDVEGTVAICLESRFLDYQQPYPPSHLLFPAMFLGEG